MVGLLNEVLHSQVKRRGFAPAFTAEEKKTQDSQTQAPAKNHEVLSKYVLPACVIGAGGILMYLGVRSPKISAKIQDLYEDKLHKITEEVLKFKKNTTSSMDKEYRKITPYIIDYRKNHTFEYLAHSAKIQDATKGSEVLGTVREAFSELKGIRAKDIKWGVSGMDEFRSYMYNVNHPVYQSMTKLRNGASMRMLDYSLMPRFKNGSNKETMVKLEEKLGKIRAAADKKMFEIQNNLTDEHIHQSSARMAKQMILVRSDLNSSAENVMDTAFNRMGKLYNIGEDFKPLFRKGKSLKVIELLPEKELKPQKLSDEARQIINNDYLANVLEEVDFNKIDDKMMKSLFERMPSGFDTKQTDMITDMIRLQQVVNKAEGAAENLELKTISGKLEYLSAKLEQYGKSYLSEHCGRDCSKFNKHQLHAHVYYINSAGRKLGLVGIEDVDRFMVKQNPKYLDSPFKQRVKEILDKPEYYFM